MEPKDGKQIKHGVNAYKRNICRCEKCTKANADYEKIARNKNRGNYPRPSFNQDTMTRRALMALREKDAARLKAKWKTQKEALKTKEEILAAEGAG